MDDNESSTLRDSGCTSAFELSIVRGILSQDFDTNVPNGFSMQQVSELSDTLLRREGSTIRILAINGPPRLSPSVSFARNKLLKAIVIYMLYIQFNFSTRQTYSAQD